MKLSGKVPLELGWTTKIHQDEAGGFYIDLPPPEEVEPANEVHQFFFLEFNVPCAQR